MQVDFKHEKYGTITYNESFWSGKQSLSLNGVPLTKIKRKVYQHVRGEQSITFEIKGNSMLGVSLKINEEIIQILPKAPWYVWFFSIFMIALPAVWGNSVTLVTIFPMVGGAMGGVIGGIFATLNVTISSKIKNVGLKLLVAFGFLVATVLCCHVAALLIISALV